jgi:hypothetical protein
MRFSFKVKMTELTVLPQQKQHNQLKYIDKTLLRLKINRSKAWSTAERVGQPQHQYGNSSSGSDVGALN